MASKRQGRGAAGGWSLRSKPADWDVMQCSRCGKVWRRLCTHGACRCGAAVQVVEEGR